MLRVVRRQQRLSSAVASTATRFPIRNFWQSGKDAPAAEDVSPADNDSKSSSSNLPSSLPFGEAAPRFPHSTAIPLVSRPLFPGLISSITLTDPDTIDALEKVSNSENNNYVSCFLRSKYPNGVTESGVLLPTPEVITDPSDIFKTGSFAQIQRFVRSPDPEEEEGHGDTERATATVTLLAHRRVDLQAVDELGPPVEVEISHWPRQDYFPDNNTPSSKAIRALSNEIIHSMRQVAQMSPLFVENLKLFPFRFEANDPFRLADFAANITMSGTPEDLQAVLAERDPEARLQKALVLVNREMEVAKLQKEISEKVEEKLSESQRKYFLNEQLKSIKKELGVEKDDKETLVSKYREQLAKYPAIPEEIQETIDSEIDKFQTLEKNSAEFNVTRSYLDWLVGIPWGVKTEENFEIQSARKVLDRDHYGLDDIKDTILQFIAIGKLKGSVQGKILCLSGPPGTGKTSIAKSIAESLGREFYRFSVGGLSDVSEIKGHRRTYIGAMPGKLIQCLKTAGTTNPVVLIDEIDKLGTGFRGDPASALLEVLDPSQNSTFRDHYLDVPVDISQFLFICTANELERIPGPLLDRMEVIRLSGYDFPEKEVIAEKYLIPKSMQESGLMVEKEASKDSEGSAEDVDGLSPLDKYVHAENVPDSLSISNPAVKSLIRWYAREAGVRNLSKYIDKITGKLALQVVAEAEGATLTEKSERKSDGWVVTEDNLSDYIGKQIFTSDRLYEDGTLPNGIVMGLAYTAMGGSALYIETQGIRRGLDKEGKPRGGGQLKATGQLGDVMQESSQIAYTVARARLADLDPESSYFDETDIHMHVPEGATPKDGPSAGVTMTTSMLSLALGTPCNENLAMTGEISLTGKVLPVGGIKEKIMAARRAGITEVVLPEANRRDFDEIPDYLKDGLTVTYATDYQQVYEVAFRG